MRSRPSEALTFFFGTELRNEASSEAVSGIVGSKRPAPDIHSAGCHGCQSVLSNMKLCDLSIAPLFYTFTCSTILQDFCPDPWVTRILHTAG
jgi:hypothetical protein